MKRTSVGIAEFGPSRRTYQDHHAIIEPLGLYLVADGAGKVAEDGTISSQLAIETIVTYLHNQDEEPLSWPFQMGKAQNFRSAQLRAAMKLANHTVVQKVADEEEVFDLQSFGAALVALWFTEDAALITHAGDCRAYRLRSGKMEQMTEDHSLLNDYIKMGKLTPEEIENFPHKNVIIRCIGMQRDIQVEIIKESPRTGDLYLLCTDMLHNNVTNEEMSQLLQSTTDLNEACRRLIAAMTKNPRCGNCTVVLVRIEAH